jgi:hypothetical protein
MTRSSARVVANVAMVSVGVAAAYVVVTTPTLRRLAAIAVRHWLAPGLALTLLADAGRAWNETGPGGR